MCAKIVYIVRGLPGSGKTTLAKKLVSDSHHVEADKYVDTNNPNAESRVADAHSRCREEFSKLIQEGVSSIAVSGTFARYWEYRYYVDSALAHSYELQIIEVLGPWPSVYDLPKNTVQKIARLWEPTTTNPQNPSYFFKEK